VDKRLLSDWIAIIAIDIGAIGTTVWKYRIGDISPRLGLISGIIAVVGLSFIYLFGVGVRNRRLGLSTPGSLMLGGVGCGLLSCSGIWLMLGNEMSANDIMVTALSSKPISEIRPEEKALVVQFFRREIERDREYKQRILQRKSPEFPIFSNASFANPTIMQGEVE
jgi:hypothetical protein